MELQLWIRSIWVSTHIFIKKQAILNATGIICATIVVVDFINTHIPFSCSVRFGIMWDVSPVGLDPDSEWIFTVTETHFYVKVSFNFVTRFRS